MLLACPCCGWRDLREFTCRGAATALARPAPDAPPQDWDDYLHNRDNPAGETHELWYHDPCASWICMTRDTVTHAVTGGTTLEAAK